VAHDNGFDVLDVIAGRFDGVGELHLFGVHGAWEEISEWRAPFLCRVDQFMVLCRLDTTSESWDTYDLDVLGTAGLE
jgi:hypothetical protein